MKHELPRGSITYASIKHSLKRNEQLSRVALLLVPPPPPPRPPPPLQQQQQQRQYATNSSSMMLKISHLAVVKFASTVSDGINNACGTSAIFKKLQVRPALLEKVNPKTTSRRGCW
jgi:hypothetical protein